MLRAKKRAKRADSTEATIGMLVDDAMAAIERDNPSPKGVLLKDYARPEQQTGEADGARGGTSTYGQESGHATLPGRAPGFRRPLEVLP